MLMCFNRLYSLRFPILHVSLSLYFYAYEDRNICIMIQIKMTFIYIRTLFIIFNILIYSQILIRDAGVSMFLCAMRGGDFAFIF